MTHAHSAPPLSTETIWPQICGEAEKFKKSEPALAVFLQKTVLSEPGFSAALSRLLAGKLATAEVGAESLYDIFTAAHRMVPEMADAARHDLLSVMEHDPAARDLVTPFLFFKGFHALQSWRVGHWLWQQGRQGLALHLQNRISDLFGVDIHPAASIGQGVMLDHATGIVIGETAVVEDNVLLWQGVTLGGKSQLGGDRHPKVRKGALLGAGATILGSIEVGAGARVAAGSVVLQDVPANVTVAGVPAQVIKKS